MPLRVPRPGLSLIAANPLLNTSGSGEGGRAGASRRRASHVCAHAWCRDRPGFRPGASSPRVTGHSASAAQNTEKTVSGRLRRAIICKGPCARVPAPLFLTRLLERQQEGHFNSVGGASGRREGHLGYIRMTPQDWLLVSPGQLSGCVTLGMTPDLCGMDWT